MRLNAHSVRLFPKGRGPENYVITGIAKRCDWVVLTDMSTQGVHVHRNNPTDAPRHIFLSLRNPFVAVRTFARDILPRLRDRFVLISGSEDATVPQQFDRRWRDYNEVEYSQLRTILEHPLLIRWFAENLSDDSNERFAALPTGMVYPDGPPADGESVPEQRPLHQRPLRVLCAHRVREGLQWEPRRRVTQLARTAWAPWCTMLEGEVPEDEFLRQVDQHSFVLCVEGGGLDPSPKAWQSILYGAIPIIRETVKRNAYIDLPVAFVQSWTADALTADRLRAWYSELGKRLDAPSKRAEILFRLSQDYWWSKIAAAACA